MSWPGIADLARYADDLSLHATQRFHRMADRILTAEEDLRCGFRKNHDRLFVAIGVRECTSPHDGNQQILGDLLDAFGDGPAMERTHRLYCFEHQQVEGALLKLSLVLCHGPPL